MEYLEMESDDNSVLSDQSLRLVLLLCGQSVKDAMLYKGDYYYRLNRSPAYIPERRPDMEFGSGHSPGNHEDQGQRA